MPKSNHIVELSPSSRFLGSSRTIARHRLDNADEAVMRRPYVIGHGRQHYAHQRGMQPGVSALCFAAAILLYLLAFPAVASAHGRHHHHHRHHYHYAPISHSFARDAGLVSVDTAAGIKITVAPDFAPKIVGFVHDLVAQGNRPSQIHCYARGGHVAHSLHYSGHACDFDQRGWGKTVAFMYHVRALAQKWDLRDGCSFTDCGHIDAGFRVAAAHHRHRIRSAAAYAPHHGDWGQF